MKKQLLLVSLVALLFMGCEEDEQKMVSAKLVLTETDYVTGQVGFVQTDESYAPGLTVDQDVEVVVDNGFTYLLEHTVGNIIKLDDEGTLVYQQKLGDTYNPSDFVSVSSTKAYVCGQESAWMYVINPQDGTKKDSINLSGFNFNNTTPRPAALAVVDGFLYVGMQRFESGSWSPTTASQIAVIDVATDSIVDTITCEVYNLTKFVVDGQDLYLLNSGDAYNTKTHATIERVNTTNQSIVTVMEGLVNGSPILDMVQKAGTQFFVTTYKGWGDVPVFLVELTTENVVSTVKGVENAFGGLAYDRSEGYLYIGENGTKYGVSVYDVAKDTLWTVTTTLNPSSLALK